MEAIKLVNNTTNKEINKSLLLAFF